MSKCKITGKTLVVQLGRDETQIVLTNGGDVLYTLSLGTPVGAVEDGMIQNQDAIRTMLRNALAAPEFKRVRNVVFTLCTSQVVTQTATTPVLSSAQVEKIVQANMDTYFPVDMKGYQVVWQVIGPVEKDSELKEQSIQLWAVPTDMLARYYNVANACGLSVTAIDFCGHSIATAAGASFSKPAKDGKAGKKLSLNMELGFGKKKKDDKPYSYSKTDAEIDSILPDTQLYLSLDTDLLGMTFIQKGQVVMQRFVRCGANATHQFGELSMMLEYYRSTEEGRGTTVSGVCCGALAENPDVVAELSDVLGIPLSLFPTDYEPQFVLCAGAARSTMDFGMPALNRPGKARREVESQLWQYALVLVGGLAVVLVVMLLLSSRLTWDSSISSLKSTQLTLTIQVQNTSVYADTYDEYVAQKNSYDSKYNSYSSDWDTIFDSLRTYNDNLVLMLEELEATLPEGTSVTNLQIASDGMTVQFACENKEEAAYLIIALRQLQYADLVAISNLSGGGAGPATSFGSGETEEPPTEGSYELSAAEMALVESMLVANLSQEELMNLAASLTDEQIALLEQVYGAQPENNYETIEALKAAQNPTFDQRSAAFSEMLDTNPLALYHFAQLLEADFYGDSILWFALFDDLLAEENADMMDAMLGEEEITDEQMLEFMDRLLEMIANDDENLTAAEALMATDPVTEQWYVYYLEVELGLQEAEAYPYLNLELMIADMMEGSFNTGDADLDAKLNALVPDSIWAYIEELNNGSADDPALDYEKLVNKYISDGTTGDDAMDAQIEEWITKYIANGTTDNDVVDAIIEDMMDDLIQKYISDGTTGIPAVDEYAEQMMNDFLNNGTTGNPDIDNVILSYLETMIIRYKNKGSCGVTDLDSVFMLYELGYITTTGNAKLDSLLAKYLSTSSGGSGSGTGTGTGTGTADTRIYFTVSLSYKDELKAAELDRKGLDRNDKVIKWEVQE